MKNPSLPENLWMELSGRLWHATSIDGLSGILRDGSIQPASGKRYLNSICRGMGCISLFDFGPEALEQDEFMQSNWFPWLGREHDGRSAIWLEIDRVISAGNLVSPATLLQAVRDQQLRGRFFCGVEACHRGPIAVTAILGALVIDVHDCSSFRSYCGSLEQLPTAVATFVESLSPPPPEHPLVRAHRELRRSSQSN